MSSEPQLNWLNRDTDFTNTGMLDIQGRRFDFTRVFVQTLGAITLNDDNISVGPNG